MKRQYSKQSGFTLVEIAIVLVIIGLLLGGVLKGQEMITSSKGKAVNNEKSGIQAAFTSYFDRYKALPGDDATAAARFTAGQCGGVACLNGNGNGTLNAAPAAVGNSAWNAFPVAALAGTLENQFAWQHLRASGFLKEGEASQFSNPRHASGGRIGVQNVQQYAGHSAAGTAQVFAVFEAVPTNVAQAMDSSVDDGFNNLGSWRAVANTAVNATPGTPYVTATASVNPSAPLF
jgi:prepilin-type N-terminal cleavage/methylation domain-containing protein